MTQENLAELLDISIKHCSSVERGLSCLSLERLIDICNIFDVSLDYLIRGNDYTFGSQYIPPSILQIFQSNDEREIHLLKEYLNLYIKLRS